MYAIVGELWTNILNFQMWEAFNTMNKSELDTTISLTYHLHQDIMR